MRRNGGATWRVRAGDVGTTASWRWRDEPPRARASRWRERLGWVAAISLVLHAAIVTLMFLTPPPPRPPVSDEAVPGEVALVFQGGSDTGPSTPKPTTETAIGPPSPETAPNAPPAGTAATPEAPATPPPPVPANPAPAPPALAHAVPPAPPVPPAPAPPVAAPALPPLAMLPAPPVVGSSDAAPPPPSVARPAVVRPVPPPRPAPPRPVPPRPAPRPPQLVTPREDAFPRPLNFAFGNGLLGSHGSTGTAPPHESLGPVAPGPVSRSAFNSDIRGNLGPDYRSLLHAWLERHKYYPPQAAENGEDGTATVRVVIKRDGSVRVVELEERSGSTWLDMGAQALFRGQRLPAFPPDATADEQEVFVTIHYILIRG